MKKMKLYITTPFTCTLLIIVSVFLFFNNNIAFAQNKSAKIDQLLQQYHDSGQFDGAVLVAVNGKVVYKKGFGYANMDWKIPNEPDTKFRIGSLTKQFVAMLIMQLVEDGRIKLDGKIIDYIPEYRKDIGKKITIFHLLTHTSGIPSYTSIPGFWSDSTRNPYEIDYMIKTFIAEIWNLNLDRAINIIIRAISYLQLLLKK